MLWYIRRLGILAVVFSWAKPLYSLGYTGCLPFIVIVLYSGAFQKFIRVCRWLLRASGQHVDLDPYDDPGASISNLLRAGQALNWMPSFPPMSLRAAYGSAVVETLNVLADVALSSRNYQFMAPALAAEEVVVDDEGDASADLGAAADDDGIAMARDDDDDAVADEAVFAEEPAPAESKTGDAEQASRAAMISASVDPAQWRAEVERVGPQLKRAAAAAAGGREWRAHFEGVSTQQAQLGQLLPLAGDALTRVAAESENALHRIQGKEKYINTTFSHLCEEFRGVQETIDQFTGRQQDAGGALAELTARAAAIADEIEEVNEKLAEKGASVSDTSPLVKIKTALQALRLEMKSLDVRIGVLSQQAMAMQLSRSMAKLRARAGMSGGADADEEEDGVEVSDSD